MELSYAKGSILQTSDEVAVTLLYGIKTMKTATIQTTSGNVTHVDIWIVEVETTQHNFANTDLDLKAICQNVTTLTMAAGGEGYAVTASNSCTITVQLGDSTEQISIPLDSTEKVVFNFVISTVKVKA